jgi:hypothetical protein
MPAIEDIKRIAEIEFSDIVKNISQIDFKLRVTLINNSFVDIYLSQRLPDRFGFHWECMDDAKTFYRYDNFPDNNWQTVKTFPYHFHNGSQDSVESSPFPLTTIEGFRAFMDFVKNKLK